MLDAHDAFLPGYPLPFLGLLPDAAAAARRPMTGHMINCADLRRHLLYRPAGRPCYGLRAMPPI
jgi:hypothetical protein